MSLATAWSNASATRTRTAWLLAATPVVVLIARTSLLAILVVLMMAWRRTVTACALPRSSPEAIERAVPMHQSS